MFLQRYSYSLQLQLQFTVIIIKSCLVHGLQNTELFVKSEMTNN